MSPQPSGRRQINRAHPAKEHLQVIPRAAGETVTIISAAYLNATGTDLTSTLQRTIERPQHEAVPTHADEAAESVPAGLPRWARSGVQLTLIYI